MVTGDTCDYHVTRAVTRRDGATIRSSAKIVIAPGSPAFLVEFIRE